MIISIQNACYALNSEIILSNEATSYSIVNIVMVWKCSTEQIVNDIYDIMMLKQKKTIRILTLYCLHLYWSIRRLIQI